MKPTASNWWQALADPAVDVLALEKDKVKGAVRTDFILSAEIIVISLGTVAGQPFTTQLTVLVGIALIMTVGVYGLVAGIVKLDDLGLYLSQRAGAASQAIGRAILKAAPWLMKFLSVAGTAAMFLVGGSILGHGIPPLHHAVEALAAGLGAAGTLVSMLIDAVIGVAAGALVLAAVLLGKRVPGPPGGRVSEAQSLHWEQGGEQRSARWRCEAGLAPPSRIQLADDTTPADAAYRLASEGTALLWRGDFQNGRHLLQAMTRRTDRKPRQAPSKNNAVVGQAGGSMTDAFVRHRQAQRRRARILGMLLMPLEADYGIALRRAPDWRQACTQAWGPADSQPSVVSLRELLGLVGAYEWRKKGVEIAALGPPPHNRIHAHYGVFSPVRGEYLDLIAKAPLASRELAFDIGTGTGVIAALLARRGVARIVATDQDGRALACARENISQLALDERVEVAAADLFPEGQAPLIVCNPPWLPARASSPIERAVYDEDGRMLRGFLAGLASHLSPGGEGWLILSDLAEHLGLRSRDELHDLFRAGGLRLIQRMDTRPRHPKAADPGDPLAAARSREVTSLWRLAAA